MKVWGVGFDLVLDIVYGRHPIWIETKSALEDELDSTLFQLILGPINDLDVP